MRRIIILVGILIVLSFLGYFIYLNNGKATLSFFRSYAIHVSLWSIIFTTFLIGFSSSWLYQLFFHPGRVVQRTKNIFLKYRETKRGQRLQSFYDACLRLDFKSIRQAYNRIKRTETPPLHLRVKQLKCQRYQKSSAELLEAFYALKQQFPNNLQVLLPYQRMAIEMKEWGLVEFLSQEIHHLVKDHPYSIDGMRLVHQNRQEWEKAIQLEKQLLTRFPRSLVTESLLAEHEHNLLKGLQEQPKMIQSIKTGYLPGKSSFKEFHRVPITLGEAEQLCQTGEYYKAANLLKRCYEKTGTPVVLDELESIYHQSGKNEKVMKMFSDLQQSSAASLYVDLVVAKIFYKTGQFDAAIAILDKIAASHTNVPLLFHALSYLIAGKQQNTERQLQSAQIMLDSEGLLNNMYHCKECGKSGKWVAICSQCHHTYSYVYKETML
ncbi:MAG: hypothetical protein HQM14_03265 [SAR324 cluster bacterium]|nr:hypothetical protein [SAR324 cluster bacterium]